MSGYTFLSELETLFLALADKTRLRLLNLMREDEVCVCFFTEVLGESQPKISRHLAYLRNAGLVTARRDGKWMHYSISMPDDPYAARIVEGLLDGLASKSEMQRDYENLAIACCSPGAPVTIMRAPKPAALAVRQAADEDELVEDNFDDYREGETLETFLL